ncbi:trk system potassium uptake protein TrkA [Poseidonocella pacifica]|uniref:Trk system potassium uptake protein TrkA n=1 Tax=Poseidonocella pacifica TaxID=871651 RepID=A0A1I0YF55_9RHOB|nr:NAD-binding protein [Poseidonocella pacifica]SFB11008.1 trk system potassium uptake protein TrkA [Poseidonocella pacifica]
MRIVIAGASRFGISTARALIDGGHEVVIIDKDPAQLEAIEEDLDVGLVHGDASLPTIQRDAFGDHADALLLLTNQDDVNILAAVVGRSVGFDRVIPQIVRSELLAVCEELGLNDLITPHATVARSIVRVLEGNSDAALDLRYYKGIQVLGYDVPERFDGQALSDLDLPDRTRVIGIIRGESEDFLFDAERLCTKDHIILVVDDAHAAQVDELLGAKADTPD